ncbi:divalent metal cation transporter, partial [Candidatus Saccharibacteria bacterium]|nr:divalent metal cation transporter [Candidatus Saccharibacteria bacterium]
GLTTGASDDDPSGIATYSQAGTQYGFQLLWLAAFTFPLMAIVQEMCARIGLVTGRGLAGNIRLHFSRKVIVACTLLLFAANSFNIGADLGAMAKGMQLISPELNFGVLIILFATFSLGLQIFTPYAKYAKYLKWLAVILIAYIFSAILAHLHWTTVLRHGFIPQIRWHKDQLLLICAILGTTISPYLFFWQTSQEVEEQILQGNTSIQQREGTTKKALKRMRVDVWSGMFLSNIVMFFIIAACGALAIPVLAGSSSYAISESLRWRQQGLNSKLGQAHAFYGIIIISVVIGLAMNFIGLDPIKALIYSAIGNGLVAPVILLLIVKLSSNRKIMGEWVNKPLTTAMGWMVTGLMAMAGVAAIMSFF